ncbi:poly [ADP-ribose] polymerase 1-like isoform X2 [Patiria miniata]|uniref:NAD(+) ADP-ribosyltransferase n=1 Tax=Patiria miniata TaxID=46514 RepID=A0A914BBX8_PATMI|nr:poly [ADP-ribose] polymerase 1-like isoform X2 [Patiria miniata]
MAESKSKLPFAAEYAKSNRSKCKDCGEMICKDDLRLALMVQSPFFDGMQPNWYHFDCFWKVVKSAVKSTGDIAHFDALRWDDQEKIRGCISTGGTTKDKFTSVGTLEDFTVEYARSNRSSCHGLKCHSKIDKDEVRVGVGYTSETPGGDAYSGTRWYHLNCFLVPENFAEVEWKDAYAVEMITGFKQLKPKDRKTLTEKFPAKRKAKQSVDEPDAKKTKVVDEEKEKLKAQSNFIWKIRDELRKNVSQSFLKELLAANDQAIPTGESKILDRAADCMTFGPLKPCTECSNGQFALANGGYHCQGNMSAWTKCTVYTQDVQRKKLVIPEDLAESDEYLASFKFKAYNGGKRIFPKEEGVAGPSGTAKQKDKPLLNLEIAMAGKVGKSVAAVKKIISKLGGKYSDKVYVSTACVISKKDEVDKMSKNIQEAKKCGVHVVPLDFLTEVEKGGDVLELIPNLNIATWGTDVKSRTGIKQLESLEDMGVRMGSYNQYRKKSAKSTVSSMGVQKVQLKGGAAVDPESGQLHFKTVHIMSQHLF